MSKRVRVGLGLAFLVLLLGVLVAACGSASGEETPTTGAGPDQPDELDGQALAEERCSECHGFDRVEAAKKTPEEWKANVERMVAKGADLNEAEQAEVIEYLSEVYPK